MTQKSSSPDTRQKTRYFTNGQCRTIAGRISGELRDYPAHLELWRRSTAAGRCLAPVVPLWGPDYDAAVVKIGVLFHPDESAVIIEHLTA